MLYFTNEIMKQRVSGLGEEHRKLYKFFSDYYRELNTAPLIEDMVLETADLPMESELVPLYEADGRVLYDPIITYPPGSPIACPGEILNMKVISRISEILSAGDAITGVDDEGCIKVGTGY